MKSEAVNLLAIETARNACSVAVIGSNGVCAGATNLRPRSHAEQLVPMAMRVVAAAGLSFPQLDTIAVSAGPGSYTGLRIGVSTAKGFASAYGAQIVGVPTLQAYAHAADHLSRLRQNRPELVAIALTARRSELYFGVFEMKNGDGLPSMLLDACVLSIDDSLDALAGLAGGRMVGVAGDAAKGLVAATKDRFRAIEMEFVPSAMSIGKIGLERANAGHVDDLRSFEPYYLKDYVARVSDKSVFERLPT
ncbi:MAG: tRNA (adenosine(37)-N6)-threonylcarbamoyltransferase complex dimerization subunit type 1 TsaB [Rhodothermales bacterium]|nr:tRNA (adenosine(37)-N6)-threonylcarbamoyltransferase complex dimerization subunit type 1 TsaB [Rhodothermales bacterium]